MAKEPEPEDVNPGLSQEEMAQLAEVPPCQTDFSANQYPSQAND